MRLPWTLSKARFERIEARLDVLSAELSLANRLAQESRLERKLLEDSVAAQPVRRTIWLTCSVALCFVGAIFLTMSATQVFSPPSTYSNLGSIDVAFEADGSIDSGVSAPNTARTWVEVVTDEAFESTSISIWFPPESVGRDFLVVLKGTAKFGAFEQAGFRLTENSCEVLPGIEEPCQFIHGTVPAQDSASLGADHSCWPDEPGWLGSAVVLQGDTSAIDQSNWAYNVIASPAIYSRSSATRASIFETVQLPGVFALTDISGCKTIVPSTTRTVVDARPRPEVGLEARQTWWSDDLRSNASVVTKDRRAEALGQILLALGAAIAGLGVGLIPVVFEARRSNKLRRRARAAIPPNSSIRA